jgi:nucleoside-diphosphate-sugar epimerase
MASLLIALTGATGFIGQHLLRELPKRGYRLRVLLRRPTSVAALTGSAVIGDLARPQNMAAALEGVDAVIHSAGIAHAMSGVPEDDYRVLNTEATIGLARAARRAGAKRFVFLSSIRAQTGPTADEVLTEDLEPTPTDAYGKSKLAAERGLAELDVDWACSPYPLPLGKLKGRRSLLSLDNLLEAIDTVLAAPAPLRRPLVVADPKPLTVSEMIAAMRHGLGRRPQVFSVPAPLLEAAFRTTGRHEAYQRLARSLVADPSALASLGWTASVDAAAGLSRLMRSQAAAGSAREINQEPSHHTDT